MEKPILLTCMLSLFGSWILYKLTSFCIYRRLTARLSKGDFYTFINTLGEDYSYRFLNDGIRRYKWRKGLLVVKATFDESDRLFSKVIRPFNFFSLFTEVNFSA